MSEMIGEVINDYEQLVARQCDTYEWRVLSWRNGTLTAYPVDLRELSCPCEDQAMNKQGNEICDHLAVALFQADAHLGVDDYATAHLTNLVDRAQAAVREIEDIRDLEGTIRDANAAASAQAPSEDDESQSIDDPVGRMESLLRDAGLDPADFKLQIDEQYGSLQIEQEGYLEDEEFQAWVDFKEGTPIKWDPNSERNYLKPDDFAEVLG